MICSVNSMVWMTFSFWSRCGYRLRIWGQNNLTFNPFTMRWMRVNNKCKWSPRWVKLRIEMLYMSVILNDKIINYKLDFKIINLTLNFLTCNLINYAEFTLLRLQAVPKTIPSSTWSDQAECPRNSTSNETRCQQETTYISPMQWSSLECHEVGE